MRGTLFVDKPCGAVPAFSSRLSAKFPRPQILSRGPLPSFGALYFVISLWAYPICLHNDELAHVVDQAAMLPISSAWRKLHQPRVYLTVEPVLLLFAFTSFLSYTVLQELLHHLVCQSTPNCTSTGTETHLNASTASSDAGKDGRCAVPGPIEQRVQTETSHWLLFINIATGVPAIFVSVFYGAISDLKGRRLFMILPALGSIVNLTTVLLVVYFRHTLPLAFLLVGAFALGVGGSFPVFNFAVFSYVSDISVASKRTIYISVLESMTFLGAAVSQLSGGPWVNNIHFTSPLYCIIAMDVVIILYVVVALPESVGVVQRQGCVANLSPRQPYHSTESSPGQQSPEQQEPISNGPQTCVLLKSSCVNLISFLKLLLRSWKLSSLLGMFLVVEINFLGITDTAVLFALGEPLCWGTELIGYFLAAKVFMNGVATLILLPLLSLVGFGDRVLMAVGLVSGGAGLLLMGSSTHTWMMFVGIAHTTHTHTHTTSQTNLTTLKYNVECVIITACSSSSGCYEGMCCAHHPFYALKTHSERHARSAIYTLSPSSLYPSFLTSPFFFPSH